MRPHAAGRRTERRRSPPPTSIGLYESEGPEIFERRCSSGSRRSTGSLDERYDDSGLDAALRRYLDERGPVRRRVTDIFITAYDIERRAAFFFRSSRARDDPTYDFTLVDAARATAAAPTYFEPARVHDVAGAASTRSIDGGVFALNPAMYAYAEVAAGGRADDRAGRLARHRLAHAADRLRGRPRLGPARSGRGRSSTSSSTASPRRVDFELGNILGPDRYVRLQTRLDEASDALDDAGDRNLEALRREGARLVEERSADLDRIVAALAPA